MTPTPFKRQALSALFAATVAAGLATTLAACGGGSDDTTSAPAPEPSPPPPPPPPPPGGFSLQLDAEKLVILQGDTATVTARITRQEGFTDAVEVRLEGLPAGVTATPVTIAAGASEAQIRLTAQASAPHSLPTASQAEGKGGEAEARDDLTVTVRGLPGAVDTSFAGGVVTTPVGQAEDYASAVAVQADGKVVVAGTSTGGGDRVMLLRHGRDGSLDANFGEAGKVLTAVGTRGNDSARAIAIQPDGKIVVAGASEQAGTGLDFALLRFNADGTRDTAFGDGGQVVVDFAGDTDRAWAVLVQDDGKIVVAGEANLGSALSGLDFALARFTAEGRLDTSFGQGGKVLTSVKSHSGSDSIRALVMQRIEGEARLLAVGGDGDFQAARYRPDGSLDGSFGEGGRVTGVFGSVIGGARAVVALPDGKAVIAGHIDHRFAAVQLTAAGTLDAGFGDAGRFVQSLVDNWNEAEALVRQADGKFVLGGWAYSGRGSSGDFAALRLGPDGRRDESFGTSGLVLTPTAPSTKNDLGKAMVLQPDERLPAVRAIQVGEANDSNHDVVVLRYWL